MKKKIIIIAITVILFLGLGLFYFFYSHQKTNIEEQTTPKPATLPNESNTNYLSITNSADNQEIMNTLKNVSEEPISANEESRGIEWFRLGTDSSKIISLDDFSRASGFKINPSIINILNKRDYEVFNCPDDKGGKDFGIALYFKALGSFTDSSPDLKKWLGEWEKTIFPDTHTILFPNTDFSEEQLNQEIRFKDGKYRYAEILLPKGDKGSLNYAMIGGDAIAIASSMKCLDAAAADIAPLEP